MLFADKDPQHVAALIDAVVSDCRLRRTIIDGQLGAVDRLRAKDFVGTLLRFVNQISCSPRARPPRIAFDFWQQFDAAERLEELRLFRPSIYKALPEVRSEDLQHT